MLLMIDNYDSFTYNLVQYLALLGEDVLVRRNDMVTVAEIMNMSPQYMVLSPGPGTPDRAGILKEAVKGCAGFIPMLGVCLGMQAIGSVYGGKVVRANKPMHGKISTVYHDGKTIFKGIPSPFQAVRYHSLVVEEQSLPGCLEVSAWTTEGEIMGLRHRELPVEGVQFHPESMLSQYGMDMLENFLNQLRFDTVQEMQGSRALFSRAC